MKVIMMMMLMTATIVVFIRGGDDDNGDNEAGDGGMAVEADHAEKAVALVGRGLAVADDFLMRRGVEDEVVVEMQRGIITADQVQRADEGGDVAQLVVVALLQFVLLAVVVFLLARIRIVLAELVAGIHAPAG